MKKIVLLNIIFLFTNFAYSQNFFNHLDEFNQSIALRFGAAPGTNLGSDYHKSLLFKNQPIVMAGAGLTFPLFTKDGFNFDASVGIGTLIKIDKNFATLSSLKYGLFRTENLNGRYYNHGIILDFMPGWYKTNTFNFAFHFAYDYRPFVNIKHKDYAKNAFKDLYPNQKGEYYEPKDGWFTQNLQFINLGIGLRFPTQNYVFSSVIDYRQPIAKYGSVFLPDIGMMPLAGYLCVARKL